MKAYSVDFREKIIGAIEKGDSSVRKVAQRFGVSKNCVQKLVTQKRKKGHILPGKPAILISKNSQEKKQCSRLSIANKE